MGKTEELLKKLRGHLAYKKQVKPYVIFNNETLSILLKVKPTSLEMLSTVKGFPKTGKRLYNWGPSIVDIFTKQDEIEDFEIVTDSEGFLVSKTILKRMELF